MTRLRPNSYDDFDLPQQAKKAAKAWSDTFRSWPPERQQAFIDRLIVTRKGNKTRKGKETE
jgi:hypothetical protein